MKTQILLTMLLISGNIFAAEYFVATNGNDSNAGTKSSPFRTVQRGANAAKNPGDIVSLRAGTYAGGVTLRYSGVAGKPITLRSYPGEKAVIDQGTNYSNTAANFIRVLLDAAGKDGVKYPIGWLTIEGLEITRGNEGIKMYKAHDIIIRNCNIHHNISMGILGVGTRVTFDRNTISNNGFKAKLPNHLIHGIYFSGNNNRITNNKIHSNASTGIQAAGYTSSYGPEYNGASNWLIANNTIALNGSVGIVIYEPLSSKHKIMNNIFYNNGKNNTGGSNGVSFTSAGSGNVINYNLFYDSAGKTPIESGSWYTAANNLYQVNPLFKNVSSFDFMLLSNSPAINKGSTLSSVKTDIRGVMRPMGGAYDIGAYEYTGSSSSLRAPSSVSNLRIDD